MKAGEKKDDNAMQGMRELVREEIRSALCAFGPSVREATERATVLDGDLRFFRLPEVLQLVAFQGLTGRLSMSSEGRHVDIYFRGGEVAYATGESREAREQIGSLLVNMGRLTKGALDDALKICGTSGKRLGRVLVEEGIVTADDIRSALRKQTERSTYKAMTWVEGRFSFEPCALPEFVEDLPVGIKAEDLVLEGVRRVGELRLVSEKIPRLDIVFTKPSYSAGDIEGMGLKPEERRALELVDGEKDVKELIELSGMGELDLLRSLYALYSVGIIRKFGTGGGDSRTQYL